MAFNGSHSKKTDHMQTQRYENTLAHRAAKREQYSTKCEGRRKCRNSNKSRPKHRDSKIGISMRELKDADLGLACIPTLSHLRIVGVLSH